MATLRLLNEWGSSNAVLALEPASRCIAHCTYCFAELNRRAPSPGRQRRDDDPGTFERLVEAALNDSTYDPTHFIHWGIRNRLVTGFANTVEPFQDLPQARSILSIMDRLSIPLFLQTKGINFNECWDIYRNFNDNSNLFVSLPSENQQVIKRFEPGTPDVASRIGMIRRAADEGFSVTLALSPFHEDWIDDPTGFMRRAAEWGVHQVFFHRLKLSPKQREVLTNPAIPGPKDPAVVDLAFRPWDDHTYSKLIDLYDAAIGEGLEWYGHSYRAVGVGCYSTVDSLVPQNSFDRGTDWPYVQGKVHRHLERTLSAFRENTSTELDIFNPIAIYWDDALLLMESEHTPDGPDRVAISQPFASGPLFDLLKVKVLPPAWQSVLKHPQPAREYMRAFWNNPRPGQIFWNHPYVRLPIRPAGPPWTDSDGNAIMVFDPSATFGLHRRVVVEDINTVQRLSLTREPKNAP